MSFIRCKLHFSNSPLMNLVSIDRAYSFYTESFLKTLVLPLLDTPIPESILEIITLAFVLDRDIYKTGEKYYLPVKSILPHSFSLLLDNEIVRFWWPCNAATIARKRFKEITEIDNEELESLKAKLKRKINSRFGNNAGGVTVCITNYAVIVRGERRMSFWNAIVALKRDTTQVIGIIRPETLYGMKAGIWYNINTNGLGEITKMKPEETVKLLLKNGD